MRAPTLAEKNELLAAKGDEEVIHRIVADMGLPEEIAARWYAYLVEAGEIETIQQIDHYYNLSWV